MQAALDETMGSAHPSVRDDIAAFEAMRSELEAAYLGKWVLFYNREFAGVFDDFDEVAQEAVSRFGKGPYLIRRVGSHSVTLPASVMYGPFSPSDSLRI